MGAKEFKAAILQEAVQGKLVPPACRQAGRLQAKMPTAREGQWFVYVIECEDGSFYKGFTADLQKRYEQHCRGAGADWTKKHKPKQLFYWEIYYSEEAALEREKYLKSGAGREWFKKEVVDKPENWQTGQDLLEEIRKERESHGFANSYGICSAKGKKQKNTGLRSKPQIRVTEITEDEIPFEIPENWCWCRLGEIVFNNGQKTPDKEFSYIDIGSIDNEHQKLNEKENFIQADKAPSRARKIVKKGNIIYSTVRPYLHNMCIIDKDFTKEPIASTGFAVMACPPQVLNKYLFYYLLSPSFDNYANDTENAKGVAYPAINDERLYKGVVPLPPLAEQKRIVATLEKFMPLIEEYEKKEKELAELLLR